MSARQAQRRQVAALLGLLDAHLAPSVWLSVLLPGRQRSLRAIQHGPDGEGALPPRLRPSEAPVCFQKVLPDGFFMDHGERFAVIRNPALLTPLIFHDADESFASIKTWAMKN